MKEDTDGSLVLLAGSIGSTFYSDVWRFDVKSETWAELPMSGMAPVGRRAPWMHPAPGGGFYVALGLQGAQPMGDLWHADTSARSWTNITFDAPHGNRAFTPVLPGGAGGIGTLVGGFDGSKPVADGWRLRLR